jgi:Rieske Fe-S protein
MTGEDQEHFAEYLELENYIEDLQAERAARLPTNLAPEQARIYRMAALFRSASPEASKASEPRPEFITNLQERLLSINQEQEASVLTPAEAPVQANQTEQAQSNNQQPAPTPQPPTPPEHPRRARSVSRRALLTGGAAAAASLAVGFGAGTLMDNKSHPQQPVASYEQEELIPTGPTRWQFVAPLAQITSDAVKFATDTMIYYVKLNDHDSKDSSEEPVLALLATCTHMGCIVNWDEEHEQFHCPCHGGLFDEYGQPAKESPMRYLKPLPCLRTKIENGNVYVEVPASASPHNKKS